MARLLLNFTDAAAAFVLIVVLALPAGGQTKQAAPPPERPAARQIKAKDVGPYRPRKRPKLADVAQRIVEETNRFREEQKLPPVSVGEHLDPAAQYFAEYMARTDTYGHEADGNQLADRAKRHGYVFCIVSENIAIQFRTTGFSSGELAKQFVEGWQKSPPHRKHMLDPHVTDTGVAVAQSEKTHVFYAVQMFGRPESTSIEFTVANRTRSNASYRVGKQRFELPPRFVQTHRLCRPAPLALASADDDEKQPTEFEPAAGDAFVIQKSRDGSLSLSRASQ